MAKYRLKYKPADWHMLWCKVQKRYFGFLWITVDEAFDIKEGKKKAILHKTKPKLTKNKTEYVYL